MAAKWFDRNRSATVDPCNSPPEILPARILHVVPCASPPALAPPPRRASRSAPSPYAHAALGNRQLESAPDYKSAAQAQLASNNAKRDAPYTFLVISSEVETSLIS